MRTEQHVRALTDAFHRIKNLNFWGLIPDMTPTEARLLLAICRSDEGGQKISDLYDTCGMHPTAVSRLMNSLEEKNLITRNTRKGNRRVTDVCATEAGKQKNDRNRLILRSYWMEVLDGIPEEDIDTMLRIHNEITDCMEKILARKMHDREEEPH